MCTRNCNLFVSYCCPLKVFRGITLLITTYLGVATEWLPHHNADRSRLGIGNQGKPDEESGIMNSDKDIKYLNQGDVALLKGEAWEGNEGSGLIHRSPTLDSNSRRLLLTIDFIDS